MRLFSILLAACSVLTLTAPHAGKAQTAEKTLVGYLVDKGCAVTIMKSPKEKIESKARQHTRECDIDEACAARGYGLIVGGAHLYLLDDAGNKMALAYCMSSRQKDNIRVTVKGDLAGGNSGGKSIKKAITTSKNKKGINAR